MGWVKGSDRNFKASHMMIPRGDVGEGTDPDFVLAGRRGGGRDERGEACPSLMSSQRDPCALATQVSHLERKQRGCIEDGWVFAARRTAFRDLDHLPCQRPSAHRTSGTGDSQRTLWPTLLSQCL